ncbi:hypothetical protein GOBAR_AA29862 [Gossypium barbadense]|uniref:Piezo non-specific cation channel cap domain-containing protein n=1 Tax=Gossypium barbadense TaxID=3634 RepID=A0A2P5WIC0_GOSBA|nr:hypothetical protein GOBAR_AA29862 [Gossypium barbadense]
MWGKQAEMFPGQKHSDLSLFLGIRAYEPGFWGIESGLRGKVLVIAACILQYNVFRWLDNMPSGISKKRKWEEPCPLFLPAEDNYTNGYMSNGEDKPSSSVGTEPIRQDRAASNSWSSLSSAFSQAPHHGSSKAAGGSEVNGVRKFSFGYFWGSTKESHKWNKKRILALRKERFETQKALLKIYLKFWIENMFSLYGLEINMIALLLASFALLNAISMLYIAVLAVHQHIGKCCLNVKIHLFGEISLLKPKACGPFLTMLEILKKKNKIFKFLRIYNFVVIVLSLAYQSPFVGEFSSGKCNTVSYIYEVIGFYKYDYGFRITARSALVEIVIFMLVSLQSYMFSSHESDYVSRYLEAEQIGAIVREQEKKAAWKTAQLQQIREAEEKKHQRNLQVEKMKSEMLNLQIKLHSMNSVATFGDVSPDDEGLRRRRTSLTSSRDVGPLDKEESSLWKQEQVDKQDSVFPPETHTYAAYMKAENPEVVESPKNSMEYAPCEITEIESDADSAFLDSERSRKNQAKEHPLISAVHLLGDGVSQVQSIGNQAVNNLVNFLNIAPEDSDMNEHSSGEDEAFDEMEGQKMQNIHLNRSSSLQSDKSSDATSLQLGRIFRHIWSQMWSNIDVVCYCPTYIFWVVMLIYTEVYMLLQYLYQIVIQHCGLSIMSDLLREIGFPAREIKSSFVVSSLPLFLVYLFTLLQSSISAKDGAETPPYFIQVSVDVHLWPEDGIQPEKVESGMNQLLRLVHDERCTQIIPSNCPFASRVQVQSIERSRESPNVALIVFEVVYASPLTGCTSADWYKSLTPAADVAKEILEAQRAGLVEATGFPYQILSVIGGGKREFDLYAYIFVADLTVFFLVAMFYQSVIKNKSEFLDVYQLEDQFPIEYVTILIYAWRMEPSDQHAARLVLRAIFLAKAVSLALQAIAIVKMRKMYIVTCGPAGIVNVFTISHMYSSGNPTNIANPIKDATFQIDISTIGGRLTLYHTTLCEKIPWDKLNSDASLDPLNYLDTYNKNDVQLICCQADASTLWLVPNVVQRRFIQSLDWDMDMGITSTWLLSRDRPKGKEVVKYEKPLDPKDLPDRSDVQKVFNGSANGFRVYNLYSRYFRVTGSGEVRTFEQEVNSVSSVSADLVINRATFEWWSFHIINSSDMVHCGGFTGPMAVVVSEETPPQGILGDTLSKFSIWGLYITFVLAVGRFIRLQCSDLRMRIPYENLPSCDRLIAICEDIYAARAEGELGVEEVLYWTLVKIYRSPHMLLDLFDYHVGENAKCYTALNMNKTAMKWNFNSGSCYI